MANRDALNSEIDKAIRAYFAAYPSSSIFDPKNPKIRLQEPSWDAEEVSAFVRPLLTTMVTLGENVKQFEADVCQKFGHKFGISSNSGSSANLLAVSAISSPLIKNRYLQPGDEVLVPAVSWSTTVWPIIQNQLIPVIVDSNIDSMNIDVKKLASALSPKTKAIMPVHVFGNACEMDELMRFANQNRLIVIEDACESLGTKFGDKHVGSFGLAGTYSFYFSHHICTVEGGMTMSEDSELSEIMKMIRSHGWSRESPVCHPKICKENPDIDPRYIFPDIGYNIRPTEPGSAMGRVQLQKLDGFIQTRQKSARELIAKLEKYNHVLRFQKETPGGFHTWFNVPIVVKENAPFNKQQIVTFLNDNGVESRPIIAGNMARQPALKLHKHRVGNDLSQSNQIMDAGFAVPSHQAVGPESVNYMAEVFDRFMEKF